MLFAYVDESGDPGYGSSPTQWFTLGCVLVQDHTWVSSLDVLVELRRMIRDQYGILPSVELKATHLANGNGSARRAGLSGAASRRLYRRIMRFQASHERLFRTFAVTIRKDRVGSPEKVDPRERAWRFLLERLQTIAKKHNQHVMVFPDEGHNLFVRKIMRHRRRHHTVKGHYGGVVPAKQTLIIEDPIDRSSHHSYFIQLADLAAYAAARVSYPKAHFDGRFWHELGATRILEVDKLAGEGSTGIKTWPRN